MTLRTTLLRWTAWLLRTRLVDAIDWEDVDLQEHVDDEQLAESLDWDAIDVYDYVTEHEHLAGPTDVLHDLEDDPERIYVWEVETPEAEQQVTREIVDEYRREMGREPRAAHFVVHDLDRLRQFDPERLASYVDPRKAGGEA